ncbi:MAG TPA: sulfotransferase [Solirubrobacteraceae bacterium]
MALPTFLVIGAGRSGTTSLHDYLGQHPDVFMSPVKEPRYFDFMDGASPLPPRGPFGDWIRHNAIFTRDAYEAQFAGGVGAVARGESSPSYLTNPVVPARVRSVLPDARLIAILRNPVERAYASYLGRRRDGTTRARTFEDELLREERDAAAPPPYSRLIAYGRYHRHLSRWREHFPAEHLRVHLTEDLRDEPERVLADLFAFVGVDPAFVPDVTGQSGRTGIVRNPVLRIAWERSERARSRLRPALPARLRDAAYARVMHDLVRPEMPPQTRARLVEAFRPDVLALQELLGRDLSHWLYAPAPGPDSSDG